MAGNEVKRVENGMEELHAMMPEHLAASLKWNVASSTHYWPCCARKDLTSLPCHSSSLKNDESGIVMIAALCAMNGDTAFRGMGTKQLGKTCKDSQFIVSATKK